MNYRNFVRLIGATERTEFLLFSDFRLDLAPHSRAADVTNPCQRDVTHPCGLGEDAFQHLWWNPELIREENRDFSKIRPSSKVRARPLDRNEHVPPRYLLLTCSLGCCGRCSSGMTSFHSHLVKHAQMEFDPPNRWSAGMPTTHSGAASCGFHASMELFLRSYEWVRQCGRTFSSCPVEL